MLRTLMVRNLALIESLELEFGDGFTCLTGETGAGKSILLDAVGLLLGLRGNGEWVRSGEDKALVEGGFDVSAKISPAVAGALDELGIEFNGVDLIVNREINRTGKSVGRINGRLVTVQALRNLGKILVQQHGQHDSLVLLKKEEQLRLLDDFRADEIVPLLAAYQDLFTRHRELSQRLREAEHHRRDTAQRLDMLRMQTNEITAARLRPGEEAELRGRRAMLQHADRLLNVVNDIYLTLYEGAARRVAVNGELYRMMRDVEAVTALDQSLVELKDYLETAHVHLSEAAEFSRAYKDKLNLDPDELVKLENRLAVLEKLFGKYGADEKEVLAHYEQALAEMKELEQGDERLEKWQQQLDKLGDALGNAAQSLTTARKAAADDLVANLQTELAALLMPNVRLAVKLHTVSYHERGADEAEILFCANQGEDLRPFAKIASGGELSRFMLALAKALAGAAPADTMIFDEIDTGISGTAAQRVAETIVDISRYHQVLCVTHQAQMACLADEHMLIEKQTDHRRTFTNVRVLNSDERIEELAKMIGGQLVTPTTRTHARELLDRKRGLPH